MRFCPLCSGSSGNATYIEAGDVRLLVDAGVSCRRIAELMNEIGADPAGLSAILVTHEHTDHIKGINILLHPDVDFEKEERLVERGILGSFDIVMLVTRIEEEFDVVIPARLITPETFRSAETLYRVIQDLNEDD